jgi:hypothetical protein
MKAAGADRDSVAEGGRAQWWQACVRTKAKWGRPSFARRGVEIRPGPRGVWPPTACGYHHVTARSVARAHG